MAKIRLRPWRQQSDIKFLQCIMLVGVNARLTVPRRAGRAGVFVDDDG